MACSAAVTCRCICMSCHKLQTYLRWSVSLSYVSHSYVSHSLECLSILRLSLFYKSIVFEQCASIIICAHPYSGSSHCVAGSWDAWETHRLLSSSTSRWPLSPRKYLLPGCLAFPRMTHLLDHTLSPCMPYTR